MRLLFFCFLFSLNLQSSYAQNSIGETNMSKPLTNSNAYTQASFFTDKDKLNIDEKMKWYALAKPSGNLFIHFDKNVYSNNETVYFTGYLIKEARLPISRHKVMGVVLIRDIDSVLIAEDKFIMKNGLSFGSITLPDSIPTGNYHFLAYTDRLVNQMPEVLFIQKITIKSNKDPYIKANLKLIEQPTPDNRSIKVLVSALSRDDRFLTKPVHISYHYGEIRKNATTDASGQTIITLPLSTNLADPNLYVKLKYEQDSTFLNLNVPQLKYKAVVKFYPEGGNMVNGLSSNIGWEVKDLQNRPIELKAFLFKNSKILDTIETSSYGIGKFMLKPEAEANYSVKLVYPNLVDSTYQLPKAVNNGLILRVDNALVKDTLMVNLKSTEKLKLFLLAHNFKTTFLSIPFEMSYENMRLKILLNEVPKGLTTLTIIDSLNRPLAERIFFAHYSNEKKIILATDKPTYKQREKVSVKLNLAIDGNALVSIAAVQDARLELKKMTDIESYTFLTNELNTLPVHLKGKPYQDSNYSEQMLLVKSWRRYTWTDLDTSKPVDTTAKLDSLMIRGQVVFQKKQKKYPDIALGTWGSITFSLIPTWEGNFSFYEAQLATLADKKMYVYIHKTQEQPYPKVIIDDDFSKLNQKLTKLEISQPILFSTIANNVALVLKNDEKTIRLKEVVITKKDRGFNFTPNACGDYVCPYNILNCRNHIGYFGNTLPVKGKIYVASSGSSKNVVYAGCNLVDPGLFTFVKGIHLEKEFYHSDYKDPNEPAFFSTLYWNYGTLLNAKKETELSFYTSDITGKFRIIVQGISNRDVIYGEHFFEVKEK